MSIIYVSCLCIIPVYKHVPNWPGSSYITHPTPADQVLSSLGETTFPISREGSKLVKVNTSGMDGVLVSNIIQQNTAFKLSGE